MRREQTRLIFAGTPDFAAVALQALIADGWQVVAAYSQPDRPAGRGHKSVPTAVKQVALQHGIPVCQPESLKTEAALHELRQWQADLMVVAAYGLLLPQTVLDLPPHGCINIHASLLPRWRGAAPIQRAIEAGDTETGISLMQMDAGLDTGAVLATIRCNIEASDTADVLHDRLAALGARLLCEHLAERPESPDAVVSIPQDESGATYARKLDRNEREIDWSLPAEVVARKVRAFQPWPGCTTQLSGQALRIHACEVLASGSTHSPGRIIAISDHGIDVACGSRLLRLTRLQRPGGRAMSSAELLRGSPDLIVVGQTLG